MLYHFPDQRRGGATVVECAIIYPAAMLLVMGLIVGGLGIFRYQQMAHLAREGARYAAVRGGHYQSETGQTSPNQQAIRDYIVSQSSALDASASALTVEVYLNVTSVDGSGNPVVTPVAWDSSSNGLTT
jgi:Flp pilus assembly protein TadG